MTKRTNKRNYKTRTGAYQRRQKQKKNMETLWCALICTLMTIGLFYAMLIAGSDTSDLPSGKYDVEGEFIDDGSGNFYEYDN